MLKEEADLLAHAPMKSLQAMTETRWLVVGLELEEQQ